MQVSRELQEYHLERLEAKINEWAFVDDEWDIDPVLALSEIRQSSQAAEQVARLQGGLAGMRQSLGDWMKKPSVILPAVAIGLAATYQLADTQMTPDDLTYMRDVGAIGQAEFEQRFTEAKIAAEKGKEVVMGVLGLGSITTAALYADRIKSFLTGSQEFNREELGADTHSPRLGHRLTDEEKSKLKEVMADFYLMPQAGNEQAQSVVAQKLMDALSKTEKAVVSGLAPADAILDRLEDIHGRIKAINTYMQERQPVNMQANKTMSPSF